MQFGSAKIAVLLLIETLTGSPWQFFEWKILAERAASIDIGAGSEFRPIAAGEVRQELTIGELAVVKELSHEFGCHVETDVHVPADNGWLSVHAAVVRGEDLVAIEIKVQHHGHGIPYFQIEHLIESARL